MSELEQEAVPAIRNAYAGDKNFIYSTWLKGQFYGCDFFKSVPHDLFYAAYPALIDQVLADPSTVVKIVCDAADPSTIWSYAVISHQNALHWVFTKQVFRGRGFAKQLLGEAITSFTGKSAAGDAIAKKHKWVFKPLVLNTILTKETESV